MDRRGEWPPGVINVHAHVQDARSGVAQPVEYELKTWLATGITTVREVGNDSVAKLLALRERAARGRWHLMTAGSGCMLHPDGGDVLRDGRVVHAGGWSGPSGTAFATTAPPCAGR